MTKKISNSDFERALNDKNNVLIMEKAILPFRSSLTHDEMIECKLISLWEAMKSWKREKRGKFTTFLYQKVRWQCIKIVQGNNKCRYLPLTIEKQSLSNVNIYEVIEKLPHNLKDILIKRYIYGMTLREISQIYCCCHETVRRKIHKAIEILQK